MYKMCPSNEVKTASFGGNLSYWVYLFVQIAIIVLLCNRFVSNLSTRCCDSKGIYKIVKDMLSRRKLLYLICA